MKENNLTKSDVNALKSLLIDYYRMDYYSLSQKYKGNINRIAMGVREAKEIFADEIASGEIQREASERTRMEKILVEDDEEFFAECGEEDFGEAIYEETSSENHKPIADGKINLDGAHSMMDDFENCEIIDDDFSGNGKQENKKNKNRKTTNRKI